jgi:hypothetical protein
MADTFCQFRQNTAFELRGETMSALSSELSLIRCFVNIDRRLNRLHRERAPA